MQALRAEQKQARCSWCTVLLVKSGVRSANRSCASAPNGEDSTAGQQRYLHERRDGAVHLASAKAAAALVRFHPSLAHRPGDAAALLHANTASGHVFMDSHRATGV